MKFVLSRMSSTDEKTGTAAQSVSHAAHMPTHSPVWGEAMTLTVKEEEVGQEGINVP